MCPSFPLQVFKPDECKLLYMLFAHIADTHLGYRQFNLEEREKDFYDAFHESVDRMIAEGVELVIHAGDLFDEPRPSIRALVEAKLGIEKLRKKGITIRIGRSKKTNAKYYLKGYWEVPRLLQQIQCYTKAL